MRRAILLGFFSLSLLVIPAAYAHQIDSIGEYRIQIGWMQEPAISEEPNGIELYVSPLDPALAPEDQEFENGISGLADDLKVQLILKGKTITLPLSADHNTPGKYFALVEPTLPGFYQVNILGTIGETQASKSLHAPRVENKEYLQFPPIPEDPIIAEQTDLRDDISSIKDSIAELEASGQNSPIEYAGIGTGITAAAIAAVALVRTTRRE